MCIAGKLMCKLEKERFAERLPKICEKCEWVDKSEDCYHNMSGNKLKFVLDCFHCDKIYIFKCSIEKNIVVCRVYQQYRSSKRELSSIEVRSYYYQEYNKTTVITSESAEDDYRKIVDEILSIADCITDETKLFARKNIGYDFDITSDDNLKVFMW